MDSEKLSICFQELPDISIYILNNLLFVDIIIRQVEKAIGIDSFLHTFQILMLTIWD